MPVWNFNQLQVSLKKNIYATAYWFYGPESFQKQFWIQKLKHALLGSKHAPFQWEKQDASKTSHQQLRTWLLSTSFGPMPQVRVVQEAQKGKDFSYLHPFLHLKRSKSELKKIWIFTSPSLDRRKKQIQALSKKAIFIPCEAILERDRPFWIQKLARKKKLTLSPSLISHLTFLEPWSLWGIFHELEKIALLSITDPYMVPDVLSQKELSHFTEKGMDAFFQKNFSKCKALFLPKYLTPQTSFPLLGLMNWYVKNLLFLNPETNSWIRTQKAPPFFLKKYCSFWSVSELCLLEKDLLKMDQSFKTQSLPYWTHWMRLVLRWGAKKRKHMRTA